MRNNQSVKNQKAGRIDWQGLRAHVFATGIFVAHLAFANITHAQDSNDLVKNWHQWRGPNATGVSETANPPISWSESSNIKWKVPMTGEGIATPIVWDGQVFVVTAIETDEVPDAPPVKDDRAMTSPPKNVFEFTIQSFDLETGKQNWSDVCVRQAPHEGRHKTSTYAAASPMTDGQQLIVGFGSFGIFSYSLDGKKQWSIDLGDMHTRRGWGEATSPVLVDGLVIMNWDNEDQSFIYALDARTGQQKWKVARDEPTTWATPLIIERDGKKQVVTNGTNRIVAYGLQSGEEIWSEKGTTLNAIPCPVQHNDDIICMAGYRGNRAVSIRVGEQGQVKTNWEIKRGTPYVPSPLLIGNRLYFTQSNKAILHCVDATTGKLIFGPTRIDSLESLYGSPTAADGRIYLTGRGGTTVVFEDADEFKVLATNELDDRFDASPILVGNKLILRGRQSLYCIESQ